MTTPASSLSKRALYTLAIILTLILLTPVSAADEQQQPAQPEASISQPQQTETAVPAAPADEAPAPAEAAPTPAAVEPASAPAAPAPAAAPTKPASTGPTLVLATAARNSELAVGDMKYRVMFVKTERKFIPVPGFDFAGAVAEELVEFLASKKGITCRRANADDKVEVEALMKAKAPSLPPSFKDERLLLLDVFEYGAFISAGHRWLYAQAGIHLLDRNGQRLWKHGVFERVKMGDKNLEDLQADNQKGLRVMLNELQEKVTAKLIEKINQSPRM
jgi:hypothetical protein